MVKQNGKTVAQQIEKGKNLGTFFTRVKKLGYYSPFKL